MDNSIHLFLLLNFYWDHETLAANGDEFILHRAAFCQPAHVPAQGLLNLAFLFLNFAADARELGRGFVVEGSVRKYLVFEKSQQRREVGNLRAKFLYRRPPLRQARWGMLRGFAPLGGPVNYNQNVAQFDGFQRGSANASLAEQRAGVQQSVELEARTASKETAHFIGELVLALDFRSVSRRIQIRDFPASQFRAGIGRQQLAYGIELEHLRTGMEQGRHDEIMLQEYGARPTALEQASRSFATWGRARRPTLINLAAMAFPATRLRRLRQNDRLRNLVRETRLTPDELVYPLFVCPGSGVRKEIGSMPGVFNFSVDQAVKEAQAAKSLGISAVILFGLPERKDEMASGAWANDGITQRAIRAIKSEVKDLLVIADVCLCEYTSHGHCGVVVHGKAEGSRREQNPESRSSAGRSSAKSGAAVESAPSREVAYEIDNDASLEILAKTSLSLAAAGADIIAPSDMMDGRVGAIRAALDNDGYGNTPILSYAAKFASAFYGPFREAADSAPQFGDRRSYQMDGANLREAMREIQLDIEEGADMVMVKPAMPYLDVIAAARARFDLPIAAYQVSGEYAMIQAAARNGWVDGERVMMESLLSIKRAGADVILTYFAKDAAKILG